MENQINTGANNEIDQLFDLIAKYKHTWPWFVLSVAVCFGVAVWRIQITPKSYLRTASVLIKEDYSASDVSSVAFNDRNSRQASNSNVKNEVEAFRSPQLIEDVVRRLDLTVAVHQKKSFLKTENLYRQTPIKVSFPGSSEGDSFTFQVEFFPDSSYTISKIEYGVNKIAETYKGKFRDTLTTKIGNVVILPSSRYGGEWCNVPLSVSKSSVSAVRRGIVGRLKASLSSKDNAIVLLEYTDNIIPRAEDILNRLMDAYNDNWIYEKNKAAVITSRFINDRLLIVEKELKELDDQLERYKSANLLPNVQSAASLYMNQSSNVIIRIMEIDNQLSIANYIKDYLQSNSAASKVLPSLGLNNPSIESQLLTYNELVIKRDELLANSSDKNPLIVSMNNTLSTQYLAVTQAVNNYLATLQLQKQGLALQEERTARQIASAPVQERHILAIEREHKTKENLYLMLLQKKEESDMLLVTSTTNTRVISSPTGTNIPVAPKTKLMMLAALFIGVGIPVSWLWGKENLDLSIREEKDLEDLSVPFLGVISLAEQKDTKGGALLVREKGTDMLNETFRKVRTNLDTMCGMDSKVIMFTSLEPGPGKTFIALNLAMTMALAGKRIVLLDLDMRSAALSRMISDPTQMGRVMKQGLKFYLDETIPDERFIIEENYFYNGFDVIPVGDIPPNPTELLMTDRFKGLIARLKNKYDYVFLDCTPLDLVTDATIVGKYADLTAFIVRTGYTNRRKLRELEKIYQKRQFKKMATILNGVKLEITLGKNYSYYKDKEKEKINELPKLPRATTYTRSKTKLITEGNRNHQYSNSNAFDDVNG